MNFFMNNSKIIFLIGVQRSKIHLIEFMHCRQTKYFGNKFYFKKVNFWLLMNALRVYIFGYKYILKKII